MRTFRCLFVAIVCGCGVVAAQGTPPTDAPAALAAAREALGGEKRLLSVKTFVATGRTRQVRGDNLVPIEFEILCELPDKFVRRDEIPAQESGPTRSGFNGDQLIQDPPPSVPPTAAAAQSAQESARRARVSTLKQDFARLTLGMFAASFDTFPLTFSAAGLAEAPEGKADVLDVKGAGTFALKFLINSQTHLPIMVSWQVPATNVIIVIPGQPSPPSPPPGAIVVDAPTPPAATASKEEQDKYGQAIAGLRKKALAEARPVEHRIYYSDYRESDGVRFPYRLRRAVAGQTIEETTFDRVRINVKIDPRRFEVRQ